ncbi:MAG: MmgE/PrpD family protein [Pseudomonadota bacterium]
MTDTMAALVDLSQLPGDALPASARRMARFSLFDWMVVGLAGKDEPLARIVRGLVAAEGSRGQSSVIGGQSAAPRAAALVNGATSHALDYDDTHFAHVGHPSVGILPAALALAEDRARTTGSLVDAFLVGAEASVRLGMVLGAVHYNRGFHQTATAGAFGAAVAAARMIGLPPDRTRAALSLVATRASGLKCQFGTMGKPYNAGIAASNGIEAALLAEMGFTSADDGIMGPQGFVPTHSDAPDTVAPWADPPPRRFLFEDVKHKLHACCHGTHAMIEALRPLRQSGIAPAGVRALDLRVNPRWLSVCDIKRPRTGLEVKFSYCWLSGMVLAGIDTAAEASYSDARAADAALADFAARVTVTGDPAVPDTAATGEAVLADGSRRSLSSDLAVRQPLQDLAEGLRAKARALIGAGPADRVWAAVHADEAAPAATLGALLGAADPSAAPARDRPVTVP